MRSDNVQNKQIVLTFEKETLDTLKHRCATTEKRSLTNQLRKILEDFPEDKEILDDFRNTFSYQQRNIKKPVNIAVKIPEEEYWQTKSKAARAHLTVRQFALLLLELWVSGELEEWMKKHKNKENLKILRGGNAIQ